jgi:hypothetical protein
MPTDNPDDFIVGKFFTARRVEFFNSHRRSKPLHPVPSDNGCIAQAVCAVVSILRHGRPSPWANTESSRITVAECFGFQIWIIAN